MLTRRRVNQVSPPPPWQGTEPTAQPLFLWPQVAASTAFLTDSNRPQPHWQPPPTACLTGSGAASAASSLLMHPPPPPPPLHCVPGSGAWGVGGGRGRDRRSVCGCLTCTGPSDLVGRGRGGAARQPTQAVHEGQGQAQDGARHRVGRGRG